MVTHSTMRILHHTTSSECVTTFVQGFNTNVKEALWNRMTRSFSFFLCKGKMSCGLHLVENQRQIENFRSRRWGSSLPVCARLTVRSSPHRHERKFFGAHVWGGEENCEKVFLINFLAKSGNSMHFLFVFKLNLKIPGRWLKVQCSLCLPGISITL